MMKKLYYTGRLEIKLHRAEVEERLRDIALEDRFFNICIKGKKLCRAEYKDDMISFFYLSSAGRQNMLSPRMHMTMLEKEEGCICDLYYSRTWAVFYLFVWWNLLGGICAYRSILGKDWIVFVCCMVIYALGIWMAGRYRREMCKKVMEMLKEELGVKRKEGMNV